MPTNLTSVSVKTTAVIGTTLTVIGALVGAAITATSYSAPAGSNTVINAPASKDIVYQLAGTEIHRETSVACTATGGLSVYDTCYLPSPLTTTGAITSITLACGNVVKSLNGDLGFVKSANAASGASLKNFDSVILGTGKTIRFGTGYQIWNPADKLKFATLGTPTGTLNATRYNCTLRVGVDDVYGY